MDLTAHAGALSSLDCDLLAILVPDAGSPPPAIGDELGPELLALVRAELGRDRLRPGKGDVVAIPNPAATGPHRLVLVGVGPEKDGRAEAVRVAGGRIAASARAMRATSVAIAAPASDQEAAAAELGQLVEGYVIGSYRYDRYKSTNGESASGDADGDAQPGAPEPTLTIAGTDEGGELWTAAQRGHTLGMATNWARDLSNAPANYMTPVALADEARALAEQHEHLRFSELDATALEAGEYGMITAVAKGSEHEPRLIVLEWNPPQDTSPEAERLAFVGKAVTFDTGGISIKPSAGMAEMKLDKSGGCSVLGAMRAIAELGVERRVLAVVGAAENMPGSRAYKPGDVITAKDGTTVEVTNTDAEGRLVLSDAITHARELGCAGIVELSTLTGAMVVALGHHFTGMVARSGALTDAVRRSAERTGDPVWHLPMHDSYKSALKSDCADMVNSGPRAGGSLYAGLFLEHFAKDTPFVHLDVAGTAMLAKPQRYFLAKGGSGWGVRLLADLAAAGPAASPAAD